MDLTPRCERMIRQALNNWNAYVYVRIHLTEGDLEYEALVERKRAGQWIQHRSTCTTPEEAIEQALEQSLPPKRGPKKRKVR